MKKAKKSDTDALESGEPMLLVRLELPESQRHELRVAAAHCGIPMSRFARKAVVEALRRFAAGEAPFPKEEKNGHLA